MLKLMVNTSLTFFYCTTFIKLEDLPIKRTLVIKMKAEEGIVILCLNYGSCS